MDKKLLSLIWGIVAFVGMLVAFIPCLGILNWVVVPLSLGGIIYAAITMSKEMDKTFPTIALVLSILAFVLATIRWVAGGFIL